jgi:hypothetical protein
MIRVFSHAGLVTKATQCVWQASQLPHVPNPLQVFGTAWLFLRRGVPVTLDLWIVSLIESEEGARRLARAIAADIRLYGSEKLDRGEGLGTELNEGRALFRKRVVPALYPLLEAAFVEARLIRSASTVGTLAPVETDAPRSALPAGLFQNGPTRQPPRGWIALVLAVLLLGGALGWWLAMR